MRVVVYGDIHGCMDEFLALRRRIGITKEDREYSVGDILNKGPKSIELLRYFQKSSIQMVRGNHEDKFIRYAWHEEQKGKKNPMKLTPMEQGIYKELTSLDLAYLRSLPFYLTIGMLTIVHAGVLPSTRLESLDKKEAAKVMRVRYVDGMGGFVSLDESDPARHFWWSELYDGRYGYIIYGHQPFLNPRVDRWSFGIDTGAVYGNRLSAILFEDGDPWRYEIVSVSSTRYTKIERPWILPNL
ncbi:MAG: protein phosphatase [Epsilonproteobacteria bacterium]|nr:protein phosphatase [Campylobacterota bacterium]NPA64441.1 protein phosphatase [Campylobacterota bacterium]